MTSRHGRTMLLTGFDPFGGETAMALAESHRAHIERHFHPCDHATHADVAAMYTADPRFQAY